MYEETVDTQVIRDRSSASRIKLFALGAIIVILVAIGVVVGIVLTTAGDSENVQVGDGKERSIVSKPRPADPTSDPTNETVRVNMLAIGDWGSTILKPGSCCNRYRHTGKNNEEFYKDYWSQKSVAYLLAQSAGKMKPKPKAIISHGDNFYWNGVGPGDVTFRFTATFEDVYNQAELVDIPWISVAGNHDIGGSMYICGKSDGAFRPCKSKEEMVKSLNAKFDLQKDYKSPNGNRWVMKDHYFVQEFKVDGVSVEIYNVDTNFADSHGAHQVCCQCYGYATTALWTGNCNTVQIGDDMCFGGNREMYDSCMAVIKGWWDDSIAQITRDLSKSTADWKIINSHFSPHFHMGEPKRKIWFDICKKYNVQVFMNGHTHAENHDFAQWGTHFFENGAGGGIQSQSSSPAKLKEMSNIWIGNGSPYGFFELSVGKEWLRMAFVTFGDDWKFAGKFSGIKRGAQSTKHCWYIPVSGRKGRSC